MNTLWQEGKTDEAVLVVQDMERRGIVGSAALYYDLARCLCSAGRCQDAVKQVLFPMLCLTILHFCSISFVNLSFVKLVRQLELEVK